MIEAPVITGFTAFFITANSSLKPFTGLTGNVSPSFAYITLEGATARIRFDGKDASATAGHVLQTASGLYLKGADMINGLVIYVPAGSATAMVSLGTV